VTGTLEFPGEVVLALHHPVLAVRGDVVVGILVPALVAALGYVGKQIAESLREWRAVREQRRARLHQLGALLQASQAAFRVQRAQVGRLAQRLAAKHGDELEASVAYERLFSRLYDQFDSDEKDLHRVIRAYTEHGLRPLNEAMLAWLRADIDHRTTDGKSGKKLELAKLLNQLDAHLLLWLAKYEAWIPNRPQHALVYLADEEEHGLGFPHGIDDAVEVVITQSR
jgi:hypothetical protein